MKNPASTTAAAAVAVALAAWAVPTARSEVDLGAASRQIDHLVTENYGVQEIKPNPPADGPTFLRRIYLDTVGRIPTAEEARRFLASSDPDKRGALIAGLLDSPGRVSHDFHFWADLLRLKSRLPGNNGDAAAHYIAWVKRAIAENRPYDQFVRELVTADGFVAENGAVGFYLRDRGMPLDHLSNTVQVFLGTQMLCAQCHDHPFDEWTQMDYFKIAAFSHPMNVVRLPEELQDKTKKMLGGLPREKRRNASRALNTLTVAFQNAIVEETSRKLELPHDYQYDDAEPGGAVAPQTPFGDLVELSGGDSRIGAYAAWMTSPGNPRFTHVVVNRLWKRAMGVGIVEPVDDFDNASRASNPELLAFLTGLMVDLKFDMRAFSEAVFNTEVYQREASSFDVAGGGKYHFPGPRLRRMGAEQVWDSLVTLLRQDPDGTVDVPGDAGDDDPMVLAYRRLREQDAATLVDHSRKLQKLVNEGRREVAELRDQVDAAIALKDAGEASAEKAAQRAKKRLTGTTDRLFAQYAKLAFLGDDPNMVMRFNSPITNGARQLGNRLGNAFPQYKSELRKKYSRNKNNKSDGDRRREESRSKAEYKRIRRSEGEAAAKRFLAKAGFDKALRRFVRASELPSPAPEGHFLREFGQSDREVIENSNDAATVPQALTLLNGDVFPVLKRPQSALYQEVHGAGGSLDDALDAVYLSLLARRPTDEERTIIREETGGNAKEAIPSVVWALLNSQQFLYVE